MVVGPLRLSELSGGTAEELGPPNWLDLTTERITVVGSTTKLLSLRMDQPSARLVTLGSTTLIPLNADVTAGKIVLRGATNVVDVTSFPPAELVAEGTSPGSQSLSYSMYSLRAIGQGTLNLAKQGFKSGDLYEIHVDRAVSSSGPVAVPRVFIYDGAALETDTIAATCCDDVESNVFFSCADVFGTIPQCP